MYKNNAAPRTEAQIQQAKLFQHSGDLARLRVMTKALLSPQSPSLSLMSRTEQEYVNRLFNLLADLETRNKVKLANLPSKKNLRIKAMRAGGVKILEHIYLK